MVIVRLMGGLGNQLFQYAAGRNLALSHSVPLKLDISSFKTDSKRRYTLDSYNIHENFATPDEINTIGYLGLQGIYRKIYRRLQKFLPLKWRTILIEHHLMPYDHSILKTRRDIYLDGYWQSVKYFEEIQDIIRHEFTLKRIMSDFSMAYFEQIEHCNSVSVHIRRGDYVSDPATGRFHGVCSLEYYQICINAILKQVEGARFFVFSDDISWAKSNLGLAGNCEFIENISINADIEDLWLMSRCKHHIIANSSYSWWGAWLSSYPRKLVYAPTRWFANNRINTQDLIPMNWQRIETRY